MARIERVSYRIGFVEQLGEAERLPATTIEAADLPEDVLGLLDPLLTEAAQEALAWVLPRNGERQREEEGGPKG